MYIIGPVKIDLKSHEPQKIRSPDFPNCCKTEEYLIQYVGKNNAYLRLTFDDLDLPPGSQIQVRLINTINIIFNYVDVVSGPLLFDNIQAGTIASNKHLKFLTKTLSL